MKYIKDIDEQLPPPPYRLGINESRFESHHLMLDADHATLQKQANQHLNQPLWQRAGIPDAAISGLLDETQGSSLPFGKADRRTRDGVVVGASVRYVVPIESHFVFLSFARYWRVDSASLSDEGSSAYTECLISFFARRDVEGEASELVRFLGVVYIDDREFEGQLQDPHALPIMLGREVYGLPKGPGQIYYCPHPGDVVDPRTPLLQIWDRDETKPPAEYQILKSAISVDGGPTLPPPPCAPTTPSGSDRGQPRGERARRFAPLAAALSIAPPDIESRFRQHPRIPHAWLVTLAGDRGFGEEALLWDDLYLYTRLVGLKQFPDPTQFPDPPVPDPTEEMHVCYRGIVESTLDHEATEEPDWLLMLPGHKVGFPTGINRVDLVKAFGIVESSPREADMIDGWYVWGNLYFGNPSRVVVWEV